MFVTRARIVQRFWYGLSESMGWYFELEAPPVEAADFVAVDALYAGRAGGALCAAAAGGRGARAAPAALAALVMFVGAPIFSIGPLTTSALRTMMMRRPCTSFTMNSWSFTVQNSTIVFSLISPFRRVESIAWRSRGGGLGVVADARRGAKTWARRRGGAEKA